jgi:tetratricopeptide (TPR) repeat protein
MITSKKTLIFLILSLCSWSLFAQQNNKESEDYKLNLEIYQKAVRYNDVAVAKDALFKLIVLDPSDISLMDSLAYLYFENQKYISSIMVSKDILAKNPNNLGAIEISALSFQNLGLKDKALAEYESLYLKNNNISTLYQIAFLQFDLKRYTESKTSVDIILADKELDQLKVIHGTSNNNQQEIPMKASILNLKGMIDIESGNKAEAKQNFEDAIKLAPEFELAKENLKKIDS